MRASNLALLAVVVGAILGAAPAVSTEYQFDCTFQPSSLAVTDPVAKEWHDARSMENLKLIIRVAETITLAHPSPDDSFWGVPGIIADSRSIEISWDVKARPLSRRSRVKFSVNRFSGSADLMFTMKADETGTGPQYAYWLKSGYCQIDARKL